MGSHTMNIPALYFTLRWGFVLLAQRCSLSAETCSYVKIKKMGVDFRGGKMRLFYAFCRHNGMSFFKLVIIRFRQPVGPAKNLCGRFFFVRLALAQPSHCHWNVTCSLNWLQFVWQENMECFVPAWHCRSLKTEGDRVPEKAVPYKL